MINHFEIYVYLLIIFFFFVASSRPFSSRAEKDNNNNKKIVSERNQMPCIAGHSCFIQRKLLVSNTIFYKSPFDDSRAFLCTQRLSVCPFNRSSWSSSSSNVDYWRAQDHSLHISFFVAFFNISSFGSLVPTHTNIDMCSLAAHFSIRNGEKWKTNDKKRDSTKMRSVLSQIAEFIRGTYVFSGAPIKNSILQHLDHIFIADDDGSTLD